MLIIVKEPKEKMELLDYNNYCIRARSGFRNGTDILYFSGNDFVITKMDNKLVKIKGNNNLYKKLMEI